DTAAFLSVLSRNDAVSTYSRPPGEPARPNPPHPFEHPERSHMTTTTSTLTSAQVARAYTEALAAQDLDRALALWVPGGIDRFVGFFDLTGPDEVGEYFREFYAAVPDFNSEIISIVADGNRAVTHWRITGTFNGTGNMLGLAPNGRRFAIEGADLLTVENG